MGAVSENRMSLRTSPQAGVAVPSPFAVCTITNFVRECGLPRRCAPRNDMIILLPASISTEQLRKTAGRRGCRPLQKTYLKRKKRKAAAFLLHFRFSLLSLDSQDLAAIVGTASLASSVGHDGFAALGANSNAGSRQLPVGATALIAAGLGHFTLRDSHGDTSLVKLLLTAYLNLLV